MAYVVCVFATCFKAIDQAFCIIIYRRRCVCQAFIPTRAQKRRIRTLLKQSENKSRTNYLKKYFLGIDKTKSI